MNRHGGAATTFTFRLGAELKRSLGELARRNERSPGAELRIALRGHLERESDQGRHAPVQSVR